MRLVKSLHRLNTAFLLTCCFAAATGTTDVFAQSKGEGVKKNAAQAASEAQIPWFVNCASLSGRTACEAVKKLQIRKTGQLLISVSVRVPPKSKQAAMMIQLPHGLYLPDGITMIVDGKALDKQPVQTCDPKGCYVGLPITSDLLKKLQNGKRLVISFANLTKNKIEIPVFLSGFKEAYAKLG